MKEQPKTTERLFAELGLRILVFIVIMLICLYAFSESQEEIDVRQYNEMIQYHQEQNRNVWSDGEFIMIKN